MVQRTRPIADGAGTHLARKLRSYGIRYEDASGCNCYELMIRMNQAGPDKILSQLDHWEQEVTSSARGWFKEVLPGEGAVARTKRFLGEKVAELKIRGLIEWACDQARKDLEWLRLQHQNMRSLNRMTR